MSLTPHPPRSSAPSPAGEGSCKSRFWATDGCAALTDLFGRGDPSPTAAIHFLFVGEAFRLPFFDLHQCSVSDFVRTQIFKLPKGILLRVISNPTPTPTGKFFASFFQKRREIASPHPRVPFNYTRATSLMRSVALGDDQITF